MRQRLYHAPSILIAGEHDFFRQKCSSSLKAETMPIQIRDHAEHHRLCFPFPSPATPPPETNTSRKSLHPRQPGSGAGRPRRTQKNGTLVPYSYPLSARSHFNEPPTMSSNSEVIACWRILLYCNCKSSNNLPALSFAICMARIRAACSEVWFSNNARTIVA